MWNKIMNTEIGIPNNINEFKNWIPIPIRIK
jgi:hypothetical protein